MNSNKIWTKFELDNCLEIMLKLGTSNGKRSSLNCQEVSRCVHVCVYNIYTYNVFLIKNEIEFQKRERKIRKEMAFLEQHGRLDAQTTKRGRQLN